MKKKVALSTLVLSQALAPFSSSALADSYDVDLHRRSTILTANVVIGNKTDKLKLKLEDGPFLGVNNNGGKNKEFAYKANATIGNYYILGDGNVIFELDVSKSNDAQRFFVGSICSSTWTDCDAPDEESELIELAHDVATDTWSIKLKTILHRGQVSIDVELSEEVLTSEIPR